METCSTGLETMHQLLSRCSSAWTFSLARLTALSISIALASCIATSSRPTFFWDDKMQAKIADFGLVRLGEGTTVGTTRVMGTPGFVDPAYSSAKMATWSADVYSFGVLMLVVLTGRNVTFKDDGEISSIVDWAEKHISNEDALSLGDPCMEAPGDVILRIAHMAISCTAKLTATRPSMARLANDLEAIRAEVVGGSGPCSLEGG
ncbi:hypothetical protein CLOM_g11078 [Closterium sp. NIES-68]|nr:hypothetical protein CLOM_g11078 [Closterium sp. NIES-68]